MMKRSLLTLAITAAASPSLMAAPFLPMDARGLAMGNTGVASARLAHAPAYNPSLLSQARDNDRFAILFPQFGITVADEKELINEADLISDDIFPAFERAIDGDNGLNGLAQALNAFTGDPTDPAKKVTLQSSLTDTQLAIEELDKSLKNISDSPLSLNAGANFVVAIPSKRFATAFSIGANGGVSGRIRYAADDSNLLRSYVPEVQEMINFVDDVQSFINDGGVGIMPTPPSDSSIIDYSDFDQTNATTAANTLNTITLSNSASDPELKSTVQLVAYAITDFGLSFSREFDIKGETIAFGITPKLQRISTFHFAEQIDGFDDADSDRFTDSQKDYSSFNIDLGASYRFGESNKWMLGVVAKNLFGGSFAYDPVTIDGEVYTGSVKLNPQLRAGVAYNGDWTSVAFDLDLVENDSVAFESATQYAAIGAEFDVFRTLQLRVGYRTNLSASGQNVVSAGIGLSPFGIHIDVAAMANPSDAKKEAGIALETGFYF